MIKENEISQQLKRIESDIKRFIIKDTKSEKEDKTFVSLLKKIGQLTALLDDKEESAEERSALENNKSKSGLLRDNILKILLDNVPDLVYIKDNKSRFILTNQAHAMHLGLSSPDDCIGKSDLDYYSVEFANKFLSDEKELLKSGKPLIGIEEKVSDSKGDIAWFSTTKVPFFDIQGNPVGLVGIGRNITTLKKTEEELKQSKKLLEEYNILLEKRISERTAELAANENRFRVIIEKTGQLIYDCDLVSEIIKWNGASEFITGYKPDEIVSVDYKKYLLMIHPDDRYDYLNQRETAKKQKQNYVLEYRIQRKDGRYIYIKDNGTFLLNRDDEYRMIGALADISYHKKNEELNKRKERNSRLLKDVVLNSNELPTNHDTIKMALSTISESMNWPAGHAIFIYNNKYALSKPQSIWNITNNNKYGQLINASCNESGPIMNSLHFKTIFKKTADWLNIIDYSGESLYYKEAVNAGLIHAMIFPIIISGQVIAIIEFFSDYQDDYDENLPEFFEQIGMQLGIIVERKAAEEELKKKSMAIEQNHASVLITDCNGIIEYTNPKFTEVSGYTSDEVFGKKPGILKSGIHSDDFYKELWLTIKSGHIWQGEICNKKKDNQMFWEQVNISPIKDFRGEITHFVAVKDDISEKKRVEEELKQAIESAETANRAKSEFLANISHEIRTPMNSIMGFAELLTTKIVDEQQRSYLESIKSSGKNLLTLINDVLDLAKIDAGRMVLNMELVDPFLLFKDIEYLFSLKAKEKGLEFSIQTDVSLPIGIEIDEVRFRQVLINLIGNAIKFTDKGHVYVFVKCVSQITVDDEYYIDMQIKVEDTGIGIEKNFLEKLFKPFTQQDGQTTKKYGGTGLGLSITRRLIDILNGTIKVESVQGIGSCFTVIIKKIKATNKRPDAIEIRTIDPKRIKFMPATIIVADDVENNRKYLVSVLSDTSLKIIESKNGLETYELALIHKPDLIITDLRMPVFDGFELLNRIRKHPQLKSIPVVATTASASIEEKEKVKVYDFDGILIKPIQINDVFLELMRILPHEIVKDETVMSAVDPDGIKSLSKEKYDEVKNILENDILQQWQSFENQQPLSEVEAFAYELKEIGKKYNLNMLIDYGNRLLSSINNFEIDTMLRIIKEYPKLLNTFKSLIEKQ
jgi:PAS domain S-box-containing protein